MGVEVFKELFLRLLYFSTSKYFFKNSYFVIYFSTSKDFFKNPYFVIYLPTSKDFFKNCVLPAASLMGAAPYSKNPANSRAKISGICLLQLGAAAALAFERPFDRRFAFLGAPCEPSHFQAQKLIMMVTFKPKNSL